MRNEQLVQRKKLKQRKTVIIQKIMKQTKKHITKKKEKKIQEQARNRD